MFKNYFASAEEDQKQSSRRCFAWDPRNHARPWLAMWVGLCQMWSQWRFLGCFLMVCLMGSLGSLGFWVRVDTKIRLFVGLDGFRRRFFSNGFRWLMKKMGFFSGNLGFFSFLGKTGFLGKIGWFLGLWRKDFGMNSQLFQWLISGL